MTARKVYEYLERIGNLLRAEARQSDESGRLQPVQLEILHYLDICNRHSNTPTAVTEYMGLTKGTVSQTLSVLETKGYVEKSPDPQDKRVFHLHLTAKGKALVAATSPPTVLKTGINQLTPAQCRQLEEGLAALLKSMQFAHRFKTFGVCKTCKHLQTAKDGHYCGLTQLPLSEQDLELICREYLSPDIPTDEVA
ncbi:MAG: MarR family winged helix-turn-helix transcriptional regulator [Methylohalobius sp. ZOD2]